MAPTQEEDQSNARGSEVTSGEGEPNSGGDAINNTYVTSSGFAVTNADSTATNTGSASATTVNTQVIPTSNTQTGTVEISFHHTGNCAMKITGVPRRVYATYIGTMVKDRILPMVSFLYQDGSGIALEWKPDSASNLGLGTIWCKLISYDTVVTSEGKTRVNFEDTVLRMAMSLQHVAIATSVSCRQNGPYGCMWFLLGTAHPQHPAGEIQFSRFEGYPAILYLRASELAAWVTEMIDG